MWFIMPTFAAFRDRCPRPYTGFFSDVSPLKYMSLFRDAGTTFLFSSDILRDDIFRRFERWARFIELLIKYKKA